ncbi:MAG: DUF3396 domain-containing protein [Gemmatimonadaceae bacterium]|jgi:hypothetical protein|nr:DUF3396 domain-containing protein [Gemmatimonadaceae bacterium]
MPHVDRTITIVRPGLGLALYYREPAQRLVSTVRALLDQYFAIIPAGVITQRCGNAWGKFTPAALTRDLNRLAAHDDEYVNIELGSGDVLESEGPYGWHLNGGNLGLDEADPTWPDNTNMVIAEFPLEDLDRIGADALEEWVVSQVELAPVESAQFGYSFNQLQRSYTSEADDFVEARALRWQGLDILEPDLAREARGHLPNVNWLTVLGDALVAQVGGASALRAALPSAIRARTIRGGLLLRCAALPPVGDMNRDAADLEPLRAVAAATRALRPQPIRTFYRNWVNRFDV